MSASKISENSDVSGSTDQANPKETTRVQLLIRIGLVLGGFFFLLCLIGWFLPREYQVSTSIVIESSAEEIFPMISQVENWPRWSPSWDFGSMDKVSHRYFTNPPGVSWQIGDHSEGLGLGKMWVSDTVENQKVSYYVERAYKVFNFIELETVEDGKTKVTWTTEATLPRQRWSDGLFYGWAGLAYTPALKGQYDADLLRLKLLFESQDNVESPDNVPPN